MLTNVLLMHIAGCQQSYMIFALVGIQSSPSIPDTLGPSQTVLTKDVLISEVHLYNVL